MKLIVDVPNSLYANLSTIKNESVAGKRILECVKNGTPLPKGHGRLIDADTLKKDDEITEWLSCNTVRTGKMLKSFSELFIKKIDATKTIIGADKENN